MPAAQPTATESIAGPALLRGLDHVMSCACCEGWLALCPVFGCTEWLHVTAGRDGHWLLECRFTHEAPVHTHEEIVDYLRCDTRLDPLTDAREWRALVLAPSLVVWQALLEGQDVPVSALDPLWARRFGLR